MKKIFFVLPLLFILTACDFSKNEVDPVITVELTSGIDTIGINDEFIDMGCNLVVDHVEKPMLVTQSNVNEAEAGTYLVEYSISYDNEEYSCHRVVHVMDNEGPIITLNPGVDTLFVGDTWIDAGVEISDEGSSQVTLSVDSNVDTSVQGTYRVIYHSSDVFGNDSYETRIVTVISK